MFRENTLRAEGARRVTAANLEETVETTDAAIKINQRVSSDSTADLVRRL